MATQLNITGLEEAQKEDEFSLGDNKMTNSGTWTKSQGGTERMFERLKKELDPKLLDNFQIICSRVRDLEDNGYIDGFRANLDPSKLGYDLVAWIFVSLKNQNEESLGSFEKLVWGWEPIRECFMLNGEIDFILKCVVKNMNEFNNFLTTHVTSNENILSVKTAFVIKNTKKLGTVPLD